MASTSAASMLKPLSKPDSFLLSLPSVFSSKAPYSYLSFPSKFIRFHLSFSHSSAFYPSLKKKPQSSSFVTCVAQEAPDWASEDDTMTIDQNPEEPHWENEELDSETQSRISDWEGDGEDLPTEGSEAEGEDEEPSYVEPNEDAKLFVGNLPYDVDSQRLAMLFEKAGVVEIAEVIYNRETDRSRGFGFVTMSTVQEAEKAVDMLNRYDLEGRLLTVNKAAPRGARPEPRAQTSDSGFRIYVGNLPWDVDNGRLEQIFSEHGKVVDARVLFDRETGRSRGFGFVTMADETGRDDAIAARDGQTLDGRTLRVNIAEEKPRRNF